MTTTTASRVRGALRQIPGARAVWRALYRAYQTGDYRYRAMRYDAQLRRARASGKLIVHFLHVRKTGGTSVRHALGAWTETRTTVIFTHGHWTRLSDVRPGEKVVLAVRDPVSRFVSGFNCRLREGAPSHHYEWSPEERVAFQRFPTPNQLAEALAETPTPPEALEAMAAITHLRYPLTFWVGNAAELLDRAADVLLVMHTKTLERDFETLRALIELPPEVQLPTSAENSHSSPRGSATSLSPAARAAVEAFYREDYHVLSALDSLAKE